MQQVLAQLRCGARRAARLARANRHAIDQAELACAGGEDGLQHIGRGQIGHLADEPRGGANLKIAALVGVQQPQKDRGAIEVGHAAPVYRAIRANQRGGTAIADDAILTNGPIAWPLRVLGRLDSKPRRLHRRTSLTSP